MNTIIINLQDKNYVRAFGLMMDEEQECFRKVGHQNCIYYGSRGWEKCIVGVSFCGWQTYAIKPGYRPEPKYRVWECKIVVPDYAKLPYGFGFPPRKAAIEAVENRGMIVLSCFSGWGGTLTKIEAGIVRGDKE